MIGRVASSSGPANAAGFVSMGFAQGDEGYGARSRCMTRTNVPAACTAF